MMKNLYRIAGWIFWVNSVIMLGIGLAFVFSNQFFPFHGEVIQTDWSDLSLSYQTLYLGMMRTEGAGYLASALAFALLLVIPFKKKELWSVWALAAIGLMEHVPTLLATFHVARTTDANPPWVGVAILMASLIVALLLALSAKKANKRT